MPADSLPMPFPTGSPFDQEVAGAEKRRVANSSVAAALLLTTTKAIVGVLTGSLGLLSEALHSGLDLVAAAVTCFAVHASDKPADAEHAYGHGKIENLSALIETLLLFVTCGWIIHAAVKRLFFKPELVEATFWSFAVVGLSIIVDYSRSRALMRVAKRHNSQALEADALHFSTDIWSSAVVLLGLSLVAIGDLIGQGPMLQRADALAALGVAVIVLQVSWRLGRRTTDALLDRAPDGLAAELAQCIVAVPGVAAIGKLRVREAGARMFVDVVIHVHGQMTVARGHAVSEVVEKAVLQRLPGADVVVHVEPVAESAAPRHPEPLGAAACDDR